MSISGTDKKKLNTVIVDDDMQSRKLLGILLKKFPEVKVVGEASTVSAALDIIKEKKPDSIFLDVCLGNDSGFEVLEKIQNQTQIVFVSAYDDYALRAFEVNALDYLKKPIDKDRLALTISRLLEKNETHINKEGSNGKNGEEKNLSNKKTIFESIEDKPDIIDEDDDEYAFEENGDFTNAAKKPLEYDDRLFIASDGVSKFIKISSIQCITAEKDYSYIYLVGSKRLLILKPMVEWEERLTPKYFVRIHRSTIVNLEYVEKVEKWFNSSYRVYIQNISEPFQMSRRYASKLKERFK